MTDLEKLAKQWADQIGLNTYTYSDGVTKEYGGRNGEDGLMVEDLAAFASLAMAYAAEEAAKIVNDWFDCETDYEAGRVAREIRERFKA